MRTRLVAAALLLLLAGSALATLAVSSTGTLSVSVRAPPVAFAQGSGANSRYVSSVDVSTNGTSFAASATGRLGGDTTVKNVITLTSSSASTRTVTLRGTQVTNVNVPIHTWTVRDGGTTVATLDMRAASPSATFTIAASDQYELDMRVKVLKGVAANEATFTSEVWAVIT